MTRMTDKSSVSFPCSASGTKLVFELARLTELMQSLREAVHRQEIQVWRSMVDDGGCGEGDSYPRPHGGGQQLYTLSDEQLGKHLHKTESDESQLSHWSFSLETINSGVGELKQVLRSQDQQVATLVAELESLRNEVKKKDKEIKKQAFLLRAEREMFDQYKKDTCSEVKQKKSEEKVVKKRSEEFKTVEIEMMKSELAHYKQKCSEMKHTVQRLEKQVKSLNGERQHLRGIILEQDTKTNQFILETCHRFDKSRKEFQFCMSRNLDKVPISSTESAVCKIVDRNARLAHDNSMLKLELEQTKAKLEERSKVRRTQSLTARSSPLNIINEECNLKRQPLEINDNLGNVTKKCGLLEPFKNTSIDRKYLVQTSSQIIEHALDSGWQDDLSKHISYGTDAEYEVVRSESEPNLLKMKNYKKGKLL